MLTTLLTVVATFAVWANRQLLDPGNWSTTSTRLLQNAEIRETTANFAVDQLYANVDVAQLIGSALPKRLRPLAGPRGRSRCTPAPCEPPNWRSPMRACRASGRRPTGARLRRS